MADLLSQDKDNSGKITWGEKNFGQRVLDTGTLGISSNIRNNNLRLEGINQQAADLENSEFNTAQETQKSLDYYDQVFLNSAKAQRAADFGMTENERAMAKQDFAENANLANQNAMSAGGGNLANYINANANSNAGKFSLGLSAQNDAVKRENQRVAMQYLGMLGDASQNSQNVQNLNFQKQILAEQAIGQAESDWYAQRDKRRSDLLNAGVSIAGSTIEALGSAAGGMTGA